MSTEHRTRAGRPLNEKELALAKEQRAAERDEADRELGRDIDALADAADLRALDAAAFALHVRVPSAFDGVLRILWNGWLEDWSEFYEAHRVGLDQAGVPLSVSSRAQFRNYEGVLRAFRALFEMTDALDQRLARADRPGGWRAKWFVTRKMAGFLREHGQALASIRASRQQLVAAYPGLFRVPAGVTTH